MPVLRIADRRPAVLFELVEALDGEPLQQLLDLGPCVGT
jgi:hypothetical protein